MEVTAPAEIAAYERARYARDARFDGRFFIGVMTTGIYCRPICRARQPKPENVRYYLSAAAAASAGLRPCRRCRPEAAPGSPAWLGPSVTVERALRLIDDGALDGALDGVRDAGGVSGVVDAASAAGVENNSAGGGARHVVATLAARFDLSERQLRRLFAEHLGAPPGKIAARRRLHLARRLLAETEAPITEVAFAAGFGSIRRFNAAFCETFDQPPSAVRRRAQGREGAAAGSARAGRSQTWSLRLELRRPFDWHGLLGFLGARAIPGVEVVTDGVYRRSVSREAGVPGNGSPDSGVGESEVEGGWLEARYDGEDAVLLSMHGWSDGQTRPLASSVARVRRLFDLDADPVSVAECLGTDVLLATPLRHRAGIRVPGCWDAFELAVRAVLGQQVTVRGATTLAGRLVARYGSRLMATAREGPEGEPEAAETEAAETEAAETEVTTDWPDRVFPAPERLAEADLESIGLPSARATTLRSVARAFAEGALDLGAMTSLEQAVEALCRLPGVGPWTAHYVAMRALGHPDAFPASDLVLRQVLARATKNAKLPSARDLERRAEAWRPWRAYAALLLWSTAAGGG